MRRQVLVTVILLLCVPAAHAGEMFLESRTEIRVREATTGETIAPLRQYLSLSLDGIGDTFVSVAAGGWAGTDLGEGDSAGDGDLSYAWVQLTGPGRLLRLGRQTAAAGVGIEQIDGAYGRADLRYGLSAAIFAGTPVPPDPDEGFGDLVLGGRLSRSGTDLYEVGLSYVRESDGDTTLRSLGAIDLRLTPYGPLLLAGRSDYDTETSDWARHSWRASYSLSGGIRIAGEFTWASYAEILGSATLPALARMADTPDEAMTSFGLGGEFPLGAGLTLGLRADSYSYKVAEAAMGLTGSLRWSGGPSAAGVSVTRLSGNDADRSFTFAQAWGMTRRGRLSLSTDLSLTTMDEEINGTRNSATASLDGGWDLSRALLVRGFLDYRSSPEMESELRGGATLVIRFGSTGRV